MIKFLQRLFSYLKRSNRQSKESKIEAKFKKRLDKIYRSNNSNLSRPNIIKKLASQMKNEIKRKDPQKQAKIEIIKNLEEKELIKVEFEKNLKPFTDLNKSDDFNSGFFHAIKDLDNYIRDIGKGNYDKNKKREIIKELVSEELKKNKSKLENKFSPPLYENEEKKFINKALLICAGSLDNLKVLIEEFGADILHRQAGAPFFFLSSTFPQCLEVLEYVAQKGGNKALREKDEEGNTILFSMVNIHNEKSRNLSKIFEFLLEKGVNPFEKNEEGISAFDRAKKLKKDDLLLLFQKSKVKKEDLNNLNYLDLATSKKSSIIEESKSFLKRSRSFSI